METSHVVLILIIVVIVAAGTSIVVWFRKRVARLEDDKRVLSTDFNSRIGSQNSEHELAFAKLNANKREEVARLAEDLHQSRADFDSVNSRYKNTFEPGDRVSRRDIVDTCNRLQLDAALLTNIIFTCDDHESPGGRYFSQADHLLVTSRGMAVIENKYWSMLVFDGIHPVDRIPSLSSIFRNVDLDLDAGEVLHVREPEARRRAGKRSNWRKRSLSLKVIDSPHRQVRIHAQRLNSLLSSRLQSTIRWIDTCVYYSYKGTEVHHQGKHRETTVVSNLSELEQFLCGSVFTKSTDINVRHVVDALRKESGDVVGTGCWSREWPDVLS